MFCEDFMILTKIFCLGYAGDILDRSYGKGQA